MRHERGGNGRARPDGESRTRCARLVFPRLAVRAWRYGTSGLRLDGEFVGWLRTAKDVPWKVSVCTGALLLGAAGFLEGKKATTHPNCYDLLAPYCAEVVKRRIVADGTIVTGGGVSASIDLGLYMLERLAGAEAIPGAAQMMDYPY